jgi:UDP-N-acetylglucosamine diphosphorylase/glucosamine-1-phosphate N-acetyltransferase
LFKLEPIIAMDFILFDDQLRSDFYPFTLTRPVSELRLGMMTIREKWEKALQGRAYCVTAPWLAAKFAGNVPPERPFVWINARYLPTEPLVQAILQLIEGQLIQQDGVPVALFGAMNTQKGGNPTANFQVFNAPGELSFITKVWELFTRNAEWIKQDFQVLTHGRKSAKISSSNRIIGEDIFFEEGAVAEMSIINTTTGPVYLAAHAEIMEGCMVRGALVMGEHATLKMGAKIYGATTIGPHCRVGGEVSNSILFAYSSKGHEGFLGNSVLGEWCNIGADTNNSNLKNNYTEVRLWDYTKQSFRKTGLQFCGLIMADHAKCGINTMFNTGTVVGVSANVFGAGYPRNYIPDFAWGGAQGIEVYPLAKVFETAERVFERRNRLFDATEKKILTHIFEQTQAYRRF